MPSLRTEITEIVTGLGTLGQGDLASALDRPAAPEALRNVDQRHWSRLRSAWDERRHEGEFHAAFNNGRALLGASEGLRGRAPVIVEWKGRHRDPADHPVPADLRIDHVYLVSCKYLSKVLHNASPWILFDQCLLGAGRARRGGDWYDEVAPGEHQALYQAVRRLLPRPHVLPERVGDLTREDRVLLSSARDSSSAETSAAYDALIERVSSESARRWDEALPSPRERRAMLWRLLRLAASPYFVLGTGEGRSLRLRLATPWDWHQLFDLRDLEVSPDPRGQPRVSWQAAVADRRSGEQLDIRGHVEVRWSHGRLGGHPEAKVYLDTPHTRVPGYFGLV